MGSIGGGGRYDDLTGVFGLKDVSGVGISFGADRIYDCLEELDLFPKDTTQTIKVLLIAMDDDTHYYAFKCLNEFRKAGISSDLYPEPVKLQKQMKYANDRKVPYTILIGETERMTGQLTLKNMVTGEQQKLGIDEIIAYLATFA
jgi:histidyl-tRNA synthetase